MRSNIVILSGGVLLGALVTVLVMQSAAQRGALPFLQGSKSTATAAADPATVTRLAEKVATTCKAGSDSLTCMENAIVALVPSYGPETAMPVFSMLLENGTIPKTSDYHDYIHKIGRATAKAFGVNAEAFFRCPLDFNYGCPHGYFEAALAENPDPKAAAEKICMKNEMTQMPMKAYFYCYHGVGHGVMMSKAYDIKESIKVCDTLGDDEAQKGCWQGAFMENVVSYMRGEGRKDVFSDTDLLAPCDQFGKKYAIECYINHSGYIVPKSGNSLRAAAEACAKAEEPGRSSCIQSVSLLASNPGWQEVIVPRFNGTLAQNARDLCNTFPKDLIDACYEGAIDNLANNFKTDIRHALELCSLVPDASKPRCYRRIGQSIRHEIPVSDSGEAVCNQAPAAYRGACMEGIRIV